MARKNNLIRKIYREKDMQKTIKAFEADDMINKVNSMIRVQI